MLPSLSVLLDMPGIISMIFRCSIYSLQDFPMPSIKRSMNSITHRIMHSGSTMPWNDSASGFTSKLVSTSLDPPPNLIPIGGLVLLPQLDVSKVMTPMPWTPPLDESMLDLTPLMSINPCVVYLHPGDKDEAIALILGK